MLGVKTSCKDRWRQVLAEADRIEQKHLATLEPGISQEQTAEMASKNLRLVLPEYLHSSYQKQQLKGIINLKQFIELVRQKQAKTKQ